MEQVDEQEDLSLTEQMLPAIPFLIPEEPVLLSSAFFQI